MRHSIFTEGRGPERHNSRVVWKRPVLLRRSIHRPRSGIHASKFGARWEVTMAPFGTRPTILRHLIRATSVTCRQHDVRRCATRFSRCIQETSEEIRSAYANVIQRAWNFNTCPAWSRYANPRIYRTCARVSLAKTSPINFVRIPAYLLTRLRPRKDQGILVTIHTSLCTFTSFAWSPRENASLFKLIVSYISADTIPIKIAYCFGSAFDSAHFVETKDAYLVEPAGKSGRLHRHSHVIVTETQRRSLATRAENHCDEVRPLFARSPLGTIGGPLLHIAEYEPRRGAPWRGYARGFPDRRTGRGQEGTRTGDPFDIYCGDACRADIIICTTRIIQAGR